MKKSLREDESARVPFAVIGIFLILISTVVSINLNRLDVKMAKTMSSNAEVTAADSALQYAKADIARAINYAGMEALKQIGETPVIKLNDSSRGSDYYEGTNDNVNEFNKNWAKGMINRTLNQYIEANYMYDAFVYNGYSVNVDNLDEWKEITIEPVKMKLDRALNPLVLKPGEGKYKEGYETYWKVSIPLKIHIKNLNTKSEITSENIKVETLITSRYPLLKDLTDEYSERLDGFNAVMAETTAFAMAYTWGRGYMQYATGDPANIVDNKHLALIVNGAVLLDQGFVFNSVDPMSIVEYVKQTAGTISGQDKQYKDISLEGDYLKIDPQRDAFNSTGNPAQAEREFNAAKKFDFNATPVADFINNKTLVDDSMVVQKIADISKSVYNATIKTNVSREQVITSWGDHADHPIDLGIVGRSMIGEPFKDEIQSKNIVRDPHPSPGVLYGEVWKVNWVLYHKWQKKWTEYVAMTVPCGETTCTITVPVERTHEIVAEDNQTDTVTFKIYAVEDSAYILKLKYRNTENLRHNDLKNAFINQTMYYNFQHDDPNLKDILDNYTNFYFTDTIKKGVASNFGYEDSNYNYKPLNGYYDVWLKQEAQSAVDEIRNLINNEIHLDPNINYVTYPIPSDLMNASRQDLINKIERNGNESRYIDKGRYMTSNMYNSASAKVISLVREWYVDEVKYQIREKFKTGSEQVNTEIQNQFKENTSKVKQANKDAASLLSQGMNLPIGLTMKAYHVDENGNAYPDNDINAWNETVTLSINQEPNYLYTDAPESDKELITLGVRNFNVFGFTGLPILPTMSPWLAQMNVWEIEVQGRINKFEVQDIDNEAHPDSIFGHEAQVYVRDEFIVKDSIDNRYIGDNLPIKFSFTTGTFIIVPPRKNIGDIGEIDEKTPHFGEII